MCVVVPYKATTLLKLRCFAYLNFNYFVFNDFIDLVGVKTTFLSLLGFDNLEEFKNNESQCFS